MTERQSIHGQWSSRLVFILAATGSAVGLGNIWKFPYITGEHGGGAFVVVYLLCIAVVGIPIMMAEIMLGRRGRQSPIIGSSLKSTASFRAMAIAPARKRMRDARTPVESTAASPSGRRRHSLTIAHGRGN